MGSHEEKIRKTLDVQIGEQFTIKVKDENLVFGEIELCISNLDYSLEKGIQYYTLSSRSAAKAYPINWEFEKIEYEYSKQLNDFIAKHDSFPETWIEERMRVIHENGLSVKMDMSDMCNPKVIVFKPEKQ